jgi:uncharacterized repeat protein (TIGR03803 family)
MNRKELVSGLGRALSGAALLLLFVTSAWSRTQEKVLYRFAGGSDGNGPGGLIMDAAGNLYGSAGGGVGTCTGGCGVIFELSPNSNGRWTETVLYTFQGPGDGDGPSDLVMDSSGNLYGTTYLGGDLGCNPTYGCGTVFKLSPNSGGGWTKTVLYSFMDGDDGALPLAGLTFDGAGILYGTTVLGGSNGSGTVFELSQNSDGTWTETVLHSFEDEGTAYAGVTVDNAGNLYGTTMADCSWAQVYKLTKSGVVWTESRIGYGYCLVAGVVLDKKGNLYGSDYCSEPSDIGCGYGAVFILTKSGSTYDETYIKIPASQDGVNPQASVLLGPAGNFYGTTFLGGGHGGCYDGCGVVFEFKQSGKGWKETVLHNFGAGHSGGAEPAAGVIRDKAGNLYGTTAYGGLGFGTLYEISP